MSPPVRNLFYCLIFSLPALSACTSLAPTSPAEGGFNLRGKMGVVEGDQSFSARFLWQQRGPAFTIDLWGPLGQGRLHLTGNGRRLELRRGDGTLIAKGTAEQVMNDQLGWSLPLSVLPQWVRGRPARGVPVTGRVYDATGRLTEFRQLDWRVELERFRPVADNGADAAYLPYRVTARQDAHRVRLAISDWQL